MPTEPKGCLFGFLFNLFGGKRESAGAPDGMPKVMVNKYFITDAERNFFQVLRRVVGDRGHVLAQVSLRQLLYFPGTNQTNPGKAQWSGRISQKSIDFVVCDPSTLRPLLAIELNDSSHARADRQTRDENVDKILHAAGLQLLGFNTSRSYDTRYIDAEISPYLAR